MLHPPISRLKREGGEHDSADMVAVVREIFDLHDGGSDGRADEEK
jgi:hypothetical protein